MNLLNYFSEVNMTKILITSALPYVNNVPHLGHIVGCHLPADVFYRFQKSIGNEAIFIGGADEHGTATLISARELGLSPEKLCQKLTELHKKEKQLPTEYKNRRYTEEDIQKILKGV